MEERARSERREGVGGSREEALMMEGGGRERGKGVERRKVR